MQLPGSDQQRTALAWFGDLSRQNRTPLVAVIFPLLDDRDSQAELVYAKDLLKQVGLECLELLSDLRQRGRLRSVARDLYHPSAEGHHAAAEDISRFIKRRGLLRASD